MYKSEKLTKIIMLVIIFAIIGMGVWTTTTSDKDINGTPANSTNNTNKSVVIELERPPFLDELEEIP